MIMLHTVQYACCFGLWVCGITDHMILHDNATHCTVCVLFWFVVLLLTWYCMIMLHTLQSVSAVLLCGAMGLLIT